MKKLIGLLAAALVVLAPGAALAEDCYTCTSSSTDKCKDMKYCQGSEAECKAAGCTLGSSSKTSCPTSANYKDKTCKP